MKRWLIWIGISVAALLAALAVAAQVLSRRFEPFVKEQTIQYLSRRFDSDVQLGSLKVSMPVESPLKVLLRGGRGARVHVEGRQVNLRMKGRPDMPPLLEMRHLSFDVDLRSLLDKPARVSSVRLEGFVLNIPPKADRPRLPPQAGLAESFSQQRNSLYGAAQPSVIIQQVTANGTRLVLLPRDPAKVPLEFDIHELKLRSAGVGMSMPYEAVLTNPKPPGLIRSSGTFGPWVTGSPGDTSLTGEYRFTNADLSVFKGIAGTLSSTGRFQGELDNIAVQGETDTPDFRLKPSGNPVPLHTKFSAIVDGTNGNTLLQPVEARLNNTRFVTSGGVVRAERGKGRTVSLDVTIKKGKVEDLLRLAVKGNEPILRGGVDLKMRLELPPGQGEIGDRLRLAGNFSLEEARFSSATIQKEIDGLSRRGQGQPKDENVENVVSDMAGVFRLQNGMIDFSRLQFVVPGAAVLLTGTYNFAAQELDFHGHLRLHARISQTMTGWKRWALKPVDPIFAKDGAGTVLAIEIVGPRSQPRFGRDRKKKEKD